MNLERVRVHGGAALVGVPHGREIQGYDAHGFFQRDVVASADDCAVKHGVGPHDLLPVAEVRAHDLDGPLDVLEVLGLGRHRRDRRDSALEDASGAKNIDDCALLECHGPLDRVVRDDLGGDEDAAALARADGEQACLPEHA